MANDFWARLDLEGRVEQGLPPPARRAWRRLDGAVTGFLQQRGIMLLRLAVAIVFIWFGALKVIDRTPVQDLVEETVYWLPADFFVPFLGVWEMVVGFGLLIPVALRLTLALFWAQMAGTLLVFVVNPDVAFDSSNPLLLTTEGEFVVKNVVLISAGLVIGSTVRGRRTLAGQGGPALG